MIYNEMSIHRRVNLIEKEFKPLMIAIIKSQKSKFPLIPLGIDDIYNELLYKTALKAVFFNKEINRNFNAFLILMMKFETKNIIRKYLTNKHKMLNFAIPHETYHREYSAQTLPKMQMLNIDPQDFSILYDCFINKVPRKSLYKKYHINHEELEKKIKKLINNS